MKWMDEKPTANAMSLSSITATVRSKGVACPKCLIPVRNQVEINLIHKKNLFIEKERVMIF